MILTSSLLLEPTYDIFVSYSRWDFSYAKEQIEFFSKNMGLKCFYDIELGMGEEYTSQITEAIKKSKIVVLFYSHELVNATWNKHELLFAEKNNKPIILVNLENEAPSGWYATHFKLSYIPYSNGKGVSQIIAEVQRFFPESSLSYPVDSSDETIHNWKPSASGPICCDNRFDVEDSISVVDSESDTDIRNVLEESQKKDCEKASISKQGVSSEKQNVLPPKEKDSFIHRLFRRRRTSSTKAVINNVKLLSNRNCCLYIDGLPFANLKEDDVLFRHLDEGEYIFKYVAEDNTSFTEKHVIENCNLSKAILVRFPEKGTADIDKFKTIHCFIAGSTELKQERRSFCYVMSRLHNQWRNRNFAIESYSYEDFPRSVHQKSQQSIYDDFIKNKSDIVMFVFDTTIGNITLSELNLAIASYRDSHKPQIYIYSKRQDEENNQMILLRKRMDDISQYWVDYVDLDDLETQFEHDMNWYLFDIYHN